MSGSVFDQQPWDPDCAWPTDQHEFEVGYRQRDCHRCGSPRIFTAGHNRICASCGWSCFRIQHRCPVCLGDEKPGMALQLR